MGGPLRAARTTGGLAFALLLLTTVSAAQAQPGRVVGRVSALVGEARVTHHGTAAARPLEDGSAVHEGDRIRTAAGARARLELEDGSILQLGEATELYVAWVLVAPAYGSSNVELEMPAGIVRTMVEALLPRTAFELRTTTASIWVRGTDWIVEASPAASATVALAGEVAVRSAAEGVVGTVVLHPGEGTTVPAGKGPGEPMQWEDAHRQSFIERTAVPGSP